MGLIKKEKVLEEAALRLEEEVPKVEEAAALAEVEITPEEYEALGGVEEKARLIVAKAEEEAKAKIEEAQTEVEGIKQAAREEGIEEGKKEGMNQVTSYIEEALETLNQATKDRKKIIKDAEAEILRLALKIAEQVLRSEVTMHRDVVLNIVSEALGKVSDREQVIVKVNREDIENIKRYKDRLTGIVDGVKKFSILEDSRVEPGGCVIETNLGYVDARISTKLKAIEEALEKVKGGPEAEAGTETPVEGEEKGESQG